MAAHTCPVWIGYLLASPLRKLIENPNKILSPHVKPEMTVLDAGCAMGFFALPAAKLVGPNGKITCLDLQQKMLEGLLKRARKAGVDQNIEPRLSSIDSLNIKELKGSVDVALAFHIVHEVDSPESFFTEIFTALKDQGKLIFSEPPGHVSTDHFSKSLTLAEKAGFKINKTSGMLRSRFAVLEK